MQTGMHMAVQPCEAWREHAGACCACTANCDEKHSVSLQTLHGTARGLLSSAGVRVADVLNKCTATTHSCVVG